MGLFNTSKRLFLLENPYKFSVGDVVMHNNEQRVVTQRFAKGNWLYGFKKKYLVAASGGFIETAPEHHMYSCGDNRNVFKRLTCLKMMEESISELNYRFFELKRKNKIDTVYIAPMEKPNTLHPLPLIAYANLLTFVENMVDKEINGSPYQTSIKQTIEAIEGIIDKSKELDNTLLNLKKTIN